MSHSLRVTSPIGKLKLELEKISFGHAWGQMFEIIVDLVIVAKGSQKQEGCDNIGADLLSRV